MHWFEQCVYFSSTLLVASFTPLWMTRLLSKVLLLFPLVGHFGFGNWNIEQTFNHYIHHSKFYWNFGSSPLWDHLMGTNYRPGGGREKEASEQARLVGATMGQGLKDQTEQLEETTGRKNKMK